MVRTLSNLIFLVLTSLMLVACGDGNSSNTGSSGTGGTTGGSGSTGTSSPSIVLALQDGSGSAITTITESQQGTLVATVLNASGVPVSGEVVSFSITAGTLTAGEIDPSSGTSLTSSAGVAKVSLIAGSDEGAATVTAAVTVDGESVSDSVSFSTSLANIALGSGSDASFVDGALEPSVAPPAELAAGGTMTIEATIVDTSASNAVYTTPVDVSFTSSCVAAGTASIDAVVTTVNGTATATYRADGCIGSDTITATAPGGLSATTSILVASATAGAIEFVSATPSTIALKGASNTSSPETSDVVFKVLDTSGNPVSGQVVDFELSTEIGGLTLSPLQSTSDSSGLVTTTVNSGTVPANVRVRASFNNGSTDIFTVSSNLVVSTGLPDQDSISISVDKFNPQGWDRDGEEVGVTARLADRFNNPVPDDTTVYFTAEGGSIEPQCKTVAGKCSVVWTSQNPRPVDGRATILAVAVGEENFVDLNGNGNFDDGEPFDDRPEAYLDSDEDDIRDALEEFRDFDRDGQYSAADTFYSGSLCSSGALLLGHCGSLIEVRGNNVLVLASAVAPDGIAISPAAISVIDEGTQTVSIVVSDENGNAPPVDSAIEVTVTVGSLTGQTSYTVPSQLGPFVLDPITFNGEATDTQKAGVLTVRVTTAAGDTASNSISITIDP